MRDWVETADRRNFIEGAGFVVATIALGPTATDWFENMEKSLEAASSEVLSTDGTVYDQAAGMCAIDLVVDVAADERVVIENELPGGNNRTVRNTGKRSLRTVVPADSTVLVYPVNLDAKRSKRLKRLHVSEECTLQEEASDR